MVVFDISLLFGMVQTFMAIVSLLESQSISTALAQAPLYSQGYLSFFPVVQFAPATLIISISEAGLIFEICVALGSNSA
jgi:hypothetical protein